MRFNIMNYITWRNFSMLPLVLFFRVVLISPLIFLACLGWVAERLMLRINMALPKWLILVSKK